MQLLQYTVYFAPSTETRQEAERESTGCKKQPLHNRLGSVGSDQVSELRGQLFVICAVVHK